MCTADGRPQKPGLYLTNVRRPRPLYISNVSAFSPVWNSKLNLFVASTENGAVRVTTNGGLSALPAPTSATPVVAPDGTVWAWTSSGFGDKPAGLWIGPVGQKAPARVVDDAVHLAIWSPDSQRVFFFTDDGLFVTTRSGSRPTLLTTARGWSGDVQWVKP
jgi:Tol biopolymer transport system component